MKLVNAEAEYKKDHKKDSTLILMASSGARNNGQTDSGGNG